MHEPSDVPLKNALFLKVSDQLRSTLRRVVNHAGVAADGGSRPVTRQALSASAEVAASTLNKLLMSDHKARAEPPNPTLEVICKLAQALNVSPALLLMTEDDWKKLASAVWTYMTVLTCSEEFGTFVTRTRLNNDYAGLASNVVNDAQEIAKMCGFGLRATQAAKTNIAATSQILPIRTLDPDHRPLLMVICAIFALSAQ